MSCERHTDNGNRSENMAAFAENGVGVLEYMNNWKSSKHEVMVLDL